MLSRRISLQLRSYFGGSSHGHESDKKAKKLLPFTQRVKNFIFGEPNNWAVHHQTFFDPNNVHHDHGHGQGDEHPDHRVKIVRDKPWIQYRGDPKIMSLKGLNEVNAQMLDRDDTFPWQHKLSGRFSYERIYISLPWSHHPKEDFGLGDPEKGYNRSSDPLDTRRQSFIGIYPLVLFFMFFLFVVNYTDGYQSTSDQISHQVKGRAIFYQRLYILRRECQESRTLRQSKEEKVAQLEKQLEEA